MEDTRQVARQLAREGNIQIVQKGIVLDPNAAFKGPIRLRLNTKETNEEDQEGDKVEKRSKRNAVHSKPEQEVKPGKKSDPSKKTTTA
mmetsp:Transcript_198/g.1427  ORF Transcript_198/g.1427 Transcript_198/m.1427 type:complete len:88 (+) Transcript_198:195-458(+)